MIMHAIVLSVRPDNLLVLDRATRREVRVNTPGARRFRPGDFVRIRYNGVMTRSIPPQISAEHIVRIPWLRPRPR